MTATTSKTQQNLLIPSLRQWYSATWDDYVALRDAPIKERMRLFFNNELMWVKKKALFP